MDAEMVSNYPLNMVLLVSKKLFLIKSYVHIINNIIEYIYYFNIKDTISTIFNGSFDTIPASII